VRAARTEGGRSADDKVGNGQAVCIFQAEGPGHDVGIQFAVARNRPVEAPLILGPFPRYPFSNSSITG